MNAPTSKLRSRLLLVLTVVLACGGLTGCQDDYPHRTYHGYHRGDHRYNDTYYRPGYRRGYSRDGYYGGGYSRSSYYRPRSATYYGGGSSVTVRRY